MRIKEYTNPINIDDAYEQLVSQKNATLLGGGLFLRLQKRNLPLVIDLNGMGLNRIESSTDHFRIGAMATLRQIETHPALPRALVESTRQVAGVAVRNLATIGGSVMGRYPFSDINTALVALNATLHFHRTGALSIHQFMREGLTEPDILVDLTLEPVEKSLFTSFKAVYTDFSLLNLAIVKKENYTLAMGATPSRGRAISFNPDEPLDFALDQFSFETDRRGSGIYRRAIAKALLEDALKEVTTWK